MSNNNTYANIWLGCSLILRLVKRTQRIGIITVMEANWIVMGSVIHEFYVA